MIDNNIHNTCVQNLSKTIIIAYYFYGIELWTNHLNFGFVSHAIYSFQHLLQATELHTRIICVLVYICTFEPLDEKLKSVTKLTDNSKLIISSQDVQNALKTSKNNKSCEHDSVYNVLRTHETLRNNSYCLNNIVIFKSVWIWSLLTWNKARNYIKPFLKR